MNKARDVRNQIDRYRFVFHRLQLWQGLLSLVALIIFSLSALAAIEYFLFLKVEIKLILFISWSLMNLYALVTWVVKPLLALTTGWKSISDREVAIRMGRGNPNVEDRIINFLELENSNNIDSGYLSAVIAQKSEDLVRHNLLSGLNAQRVVKAAWIASIPTLVVLVLSLFNGNLFLEGSQRFLDYNTAYVPQAPFNFDTQFDYEVEKGKPLVLDVKLSGKQIPENVTLNLGGEVLPMRSVGKGHFQWSIERVAKDMSFSFEALGFRSAQGNIRVLKVPSLIDFRLEIIPPGYTGIEPFIKEGTGDAVVPEGSKVVWKMNWLDADSIYIVSDQSKAVELEEKQSTQWSGFKTAAANMKYFITAKNRNGTRFTSGNYQLETVSDERPRLKVNWEIDSLTGRVYISGVSSDDYGIRYTRIEVKGDSSYSFPVTGLATSWSAVFTATSGVKSFQVVAGDNDGVNGSKSTTAGPFDLNLKSNSERSKELNNRDKERVDQMRQFRERQETIEELQRTMDQQMIEGASEWKNEQMRERVQESQEELLRDWNQMLDQFRKENEERILNDPENRENAEKREQLQKLMEEMDRERLEELLKEMEERAEQMDQDNLRDWMRRVQHENERMERDAERLEELMKRLNFEQELDQSVQELEQLQQRQEELAERSDDVQEEQEQLNQEFEEWKNNLDSLEEQNKELKKPMDFSPPKEEAESTQESMEKSSEQLQNENSDGANEEQKQSSESMQEMLEKMSTSIMGMQMNMHVENLANLRRILTNLIHLSEDQEGLNGQVQSSQSTDAMVVEWMKNQQDLRKGYQIVDDSLSALIGRIPQIEAVVTEWMVMAKDNMEESNNSLSERQLPKSTSEMRTSMLALNELSLMLDMTMDQIQQQMSGMMKGDQTCQKPGGGKPSMSNMRMQQQQLSQQMQQMGMQQGSGKSQEGNEQGEQQGEGGKGEGGMSQELVEMMSRQAEIRRMLEEAGSSGNNGNQQLEEMLEENERDLANRNFDAEFFERQKEIEVKMLELERAERLQEQDDQRKSNTGDRYQELLQSREEEYLRQRREQLEELRFEAPVLTPYYRQRSGSYLRQP